MSSHKALLHSSPLPLVPPPSPQPPPLPAGFVQPPPPPSPSVPPTPPSQVSTKSEVEQPPMPSSPYPADSLCMNDAPTARGSVGRLLQPDAAVVKRGDTVLTRVGQTRQPSSQGSLQPMSLEQSRKQTIGLHRPSTTDSTRTEPETETHVSVLNQMLTGFTINSNNRKIPGGCIEQTSGMPSESARIVKVVI